MKVLDHSYIKTVSNFVVEPDPRLEFFDDKYIIERNGRQLIHLKTNIDTLLLQGIRIPPVFLPISINGQLNFDDLPWRNIPQHINEVLDRITDVVGKDPAFKNLLGTSYEERQVFHSEKKDKTVPVFVSIDF